MENSEVKRDGSIQSFLDTIRKEGLERAEAEAEIILDRARKEAEGIIESARREAEHRIEEAEERISRLENAFRQSITSAAATAVRAVRSEIVEMSERIVAENVREALDAEMMRRMIVKIVEAWNPGNEGGGLEVLLSEKDLESLKKAVKASLRERLLSGVELKPVPDVNAGFRIGLREEGMHYDFTAETIAEIISEYLSPAVSRFLEKDLDGAGPEREDEPDR